MKKIYLTLLGCLLALMTTFGVCSLCDVDPEIIETGRVNKPQFSLLSALSGEYTSDAEAYYADTFPGRASFVSANRALNRFYFFSPMQNNMLVITHQGGAEQGGERLPAEEISGAVTAPPVVPPAVPEDPVTLPYDEPGEDDPDEAELLETPSEEQESAEDPTPEEPVISNTVQQAGNVIVIGTRAMEVPHMSLGAVQSYGAAVSRIASALPGVRTFSLITPNGAQFYTPESMHSGSADQKTLIRTAYAGMTGVTGVDAYSRIERHSDEYLFFRTDHHWTQLGAYYAYQAFCESAGFTANDLASYRSGRYDTFVGSMYTFTSGYPQSQILLNNPDSLTYYLPLHNTSAQYYESASLTYGVSVPVVATNVQSSNKYLCYLCGDTPICVIDSDAAGGVCLVVKNSYGNAFVPFLTDHYSRVIAVDPREFYGEGKPALDLAQFAKDQGVNDLIVIDYPFMVSNAHYANILNNLIP